MIGDIRETIERAGKEHKTIIITYTDAKGNFSARETEPYEIKDDDKYYGYCLVKNGIRAFKLDNITSVTLTENTFVPRFPVQF